MCFYSLFHDKIKKKRGGIQPKLDTVEKEQALKLMLL